MTYLEVFEATWEELSTSSRGIHKDTSLGWLCFLKKLKLLEPYPT